MVVQVLEQVVNLLPHGRRVMHIIPEPEVLRVLLEARAAVVERYFIHEELMSFILDLDVSIRVLGAGAAHTVEVTLEHT